MHNRKSDGGPTYLFITKGVASLPRKHSILTLCCINVGPLSATLAEYVAPLSTYVAVVAEGGNVMAWLSGGSEDVTQGYR